MSPQALCGDRHRFRELRDMVSGVTWGELRAVVAGATWKLASDEARSGYAEMRASDTCHPARWYISRSLNSGQGLAGRYAASACRVAPGNAPIVRPSAGTRQRTRSLPLDPVRPTDFKPLLLFGAGLSDSHRPHGRDGQSMRVVGKVRQVASGG